MKIIVVPDSRLRQENRSIKKVDKKTIGLINDLIATINDPKNPEGVGLAAPQIGRNFKVFITKFSKEKIKPYINPEIIDHSVKKTLIENDFSLEGCLSIPKIYGYVERWEEIKLKYQIIDGEDLVTKTQVFKGYRARVIQHEYDHLSGILFTDHILESQTKFFIMENKRFVRCRNYQILSSLV